MYGTVAWDRPDERERAAETAFLIHLVEVVGRENSENSETMNTAKYMVRFNI